MEIVNISEHQTLCRACLTEVGPFSSSHRVTEIYEKYTRIKIPATDSTNICAACTKIFETFERFIEKCIDSDEKLRALQIEDFSDRESVESLPQFICELCGEKVCTKAELKVHIGHHEAWQCHVCLKSTFKSKNDLKTHTKRVHYEGERFVCDLCCKNFKSRDAIQKHMKHFHIKARKKFICKSCQRPFKNVGDMNYHYKTQHLKIKNHICDECGLAYETPSRLKFHVMSVHMKLKPFKCDQCGKEYRQKNELRTHVEYFHQGVKTHVCRFCGRDFFHSRVLKHHEMTHTGERPHVCGVCQRGFIQSTALKKHLKTHLKNK